MSTDTINLDIMCMISIGYDLRSTFKKPLTKFTLLLVWNDLQSLPNIHICLTCNTTIKFVLIKDPHRAKSLQIYYQRKKLKKLERVCGEHSFPFIGKCLSEYDSRSIVGFDVVKAIHKW